MLTSFLVQLDYHFLGRSLYPQVCPPRYFSQLYMTRCKVSSFREHPPLWLSYSAEIALLPDSYRVSYHLTLAHIVKEVPHTDSV